MQYSTTKLLFVFLTLFYFSGAYPILNINSFPLSILNADNKSHNNNTNHWYYGNKKTFDVKNDKAEMTIPTERSIEIDVLGNDTGKNLKIREVSTPGYGSAWSSGSKIVYQPAWNFIGTDSFTYKVSEGWSSNTIKTATVTVTVNGPTAPEAKDITLKTDVRTQVSKTIPLESWQSFSYYDFTPSNGEAWANNTTITYQPNWNYPGGKDSFNYEIQDIFGRTSTATVTIEVAEVDLPKANDIEATTDLRKQVRIPAIENNTGYEIEFDWDYPLSPKHGEAWTSGKNIVYEPSWDYEGGIDSFKYAIQDSFGRTAEATITVNVKPEPPVLKDDTATTTTGKPVTISVLSNDEGTSLAISSISSPSHGKAEISGDNIIYTPNDNWTGTDTFTYTVQDSAGQEETGNVSVEVTALQTQGMSISSAPITSNMNQSKIDGTKIKYLHSGTYNANTVIIRPKQKNEIITLDEKPFVLIKNKSYTITAKSGKIKVILSGKTHSHRPMQFIKGDVSISPMPEPATEISAKDDIYELEKENTWYELPILENDTGSGTLKIKSIDTKPEHGKAIIKQKTLIRYKYYKKYTGIDTLTYTIRDGCGQTASAEVILYCGIKKINAVDDTAATSMGTAVTIPVLKNDSGESISIKSVETPTTGKAEISGNNIIYTPPKSFEGTVTFSYTIKDKYDIETSANITVEVSGSGGGEVGPLRQAIYKAAIDTKADIDTDFTADSYNQADALPPINLLLYKNVFTELTDKNNDIYVQPNLEVNDEERIWLQENIKDKMSNLLDLRLELEAGTDTEAQQNFNNFNNEKNTLIDNLNYWIENHPDDSGYDANNY